MTSIRELMTKGVISCRGDASLATVAATLARHHVHAVFVTDEAGLPAGVLSDFDLLTGEWLGSEPEALRTMQSVTAGELMSSPVETIGVEETVSGAASRMRELHLSRLLVLDDRAAAVGVISVSDLVAPLGRPSGARQTVSDVMSHAIVTCPPETTSLQAAARAMTERRSRSIVVVDEHGHAVGVITGNDLLLALRAGRAGSHSGRSDDPADHLRSRPPACRRRPT